MEEGGEAWVFGVKVGETGGEAEGGDGTVLLLLGLGGEEVAESAEGCWDGMERGGRGRARAIGGVEGLVTTREENGRER
jgi:hypothetical protein